MLTIIHQKKWRMLRAVSAGMTLLMFHATSICPASAADPSPAVSPVTASLLPPSFQPVTLQGLTIHPDKPFVFDFLIKNAGNDEDQQAFEQDAYKLIKYFMAALTTPEKDLWVNLSPFEPDRIIADSLGRTQMGRDMLEQDYLLKQLTASLMNPESETGRKFWEKVYEKIYNQGSGVRGQESGKTESLLLTPDSLQTFNKIWIVPDTGYFYEHDQSVFIADARLKVMLESDYLAEVVSTGTVSTGAVPDDQDHVKQMIRNIILPVIEEEVNHGQRFAPLRQIYNAMLLSLWFKTRLKEHVLSKIYVDQDHVQGIDRIESAEIDAIYLQYLQAYQKGAHDLIREEYDPVSARIIPVRYFSGGLDHFQKIAGNEPAELSPEDFEGVVKVSAAMMASDGQDAFDSDRFRDFVTEKIRGVYEDVFDFMQMRGLKLSGKKADQTPVTLASYLAQILTVNYADQTMDLGGRAGFIGEETIGKEEIRTIRIMIKKLKYKTPRNDSKTLGQLKYYWVQISLYEKLLKKKKIYVKDMNSFPDQIIFLDPDDGTRNFKLWVKGKDKKATTDVCYSFMLTQKNGQGVYEGVYGTAFGPFAQITLPAQQQIGSPLFELGFDGQVRAYSSSLKEPLILKPPGDFSAELKFFARKSQSYADDPYIKQLISAMTSKGVSFDTKGGGAPSVYGLMKVIARDGFNGIYNPAAKAWDWGLVFAVMKLGGKVFYAEDETEFTGLTEKDIRNAIAEKEVPLKLLIFIDPEIAEKVMDQYKSKIDEAMMTKNEVSDVVADAELSAPGGIDLSVEQADIRFPSGLSRIHFAEVDSAMLSRFKGPVVPVIFQSKAVSVEEMMRLMGL